MRPLQTALRQAMTSRLMRVAIIMWVVWSMAALVGAVAMLTVELSGQGDGETLLIAAIWLLSIPLVGLVLWFIAGSIRWVLAPKG